MFEHDVLLWKPEKKLLHRTTRAKLGKSGDGASFSNSSTVALRESARLVPAKTGNGVKEINLFNVKDLPVSGQLRIERFSGQERVLPKPRLSFLAVTRQINLAARHLAQPIPQISRSE